MSPIVEVDNISAYREHCELLEGKTIRPPFQVSNSLELGIIEDPDGHIVTLKKRME